MTARILALVPTIPPRRRSCTRLLAELAKQSRPPDGVLLCLDGYGEAEAPSCPLPVVQLRTPALSGPGAKWRVVRELNGCPVDAEPGAARGVHWTQTPGDAPSVHPLAPDDVLVCIDDDAMLRDAPHFIRELVATMGAGAAAAMGRTAAGRFAPPGAVSHGPLVYGCGLGLTVRVGHLAGLHDLAERVRRAGGPDALGPAGDDDALVSAHLWLQGVPILHAAAGNVYAAPGTQESSHTVVRRRRGEGIEDQKRAIARITGWPWPGFRSIR